MTTEAEKRAHKKYLSKCDDIRIRPPKGTKNVWMDTAERHGKSLQRFITETVNEKCQELKEQEDVR